MNCRLCDSPDCLLIFSDSVREYYHCAVCDLIFVPASQFVPIEEERARYELHDNNSEHAGYRSFLREVAAVVEQVTVRGGRILDFGCGKNAVLASMLREQGYSCTAYDPLYGLGMEFNLFTYDTIVLCEVIEHVRNLKEELRIISGLLNPSGTLVVRTGIHPRPESFGSWWYKNDPTHVNFLGKPTFAWIARAFGFARLDSGTKDIVCLTRSGRRSGRAITAGSG